MRFKFPFDKLLAHKKTVEDAARRDWSEAQAAVDASNRELSEMYAQIDHSRARLGQLESNGGPLGPALAHIDEFIQGQKIRIERHRVRLRELMAEAERRHEIVVEIAKERKTLEKLRERRLDEFKVRQEREEQKQVDELVVTRFKRQEVG